MKLILSLAATAAFATVLSTAAIATPRGYRNNSPDANARQHQGQGQSQGQHQSARSSAAAAAAAASRSSAAVDSSVQGSVTGTNEAVGTGNVTDTAIDASDTSRFSTSPFTSVTLPNPAIAPIVAPEGNSFSYSNGQRSVGCSLEGATASSLTLYVLNFQRAESNNLSIPEDCQSAIDTIVAGDVYQNLLPLMEGMPEETQQAIKTELVQVNLRILGISTQDVLLEDIRIRSSETTIDDIRAESERLQGILLGR